ncbi:phosphotransferase [Streptomyces sp. SID13031]|uniref:phosphotransferase n=1 Tax=Streptomyces sp. SID13031 TaxID=2706046 RepID=UPI0013C986CA|nr:phosphotransferase [Streptomyces sp. SID13031]NEA33022.1 phosphotransferase [Streptomyces sp. SID13031]
MHWEPEDDWVALTAGTGVSNGGVWLTPGGLVAKRLLPGVERPDHYAYWRRPAEVASSGLVEGTAGVRAPRCVKVDSDPDGVTVWSVAVSPVAIAPEELAAAVGRFGLNSMVPTEWFARRILRDRLANDEQGDGWAPLAGEDRLPVGLRRDCEALWARRYELMDELDALPQQVVHGDAHPVNLLGCEGDEVIAVDWEQFGVGPVGFDLAYLVVSTPAPIDVLLPAFQAGSRSAWPVEAVRRGAVLTAAITVVARAAWSLRQVEPGDYLERLERLAQVVEEAARQAAWKAG